ncbi:MAG TPA: nitrilase-related carbon-nitrogen hydrolase, partial [Opitutaceae bacterium]
MDSRVTNLTRTAAAVALSAFGFWFGTGLHPIWWVTWLAPLPVLIAAPRLGNGQLFAAAFLARFLGDLNAWTYASLLPLIPHLLFVLIPAVQFGLSVLLFGIATRRGTIWTAWLSLPAAWVTSEFLIAELSPHATFENLAYNQMDFLPGIQIASITGIWGISFCLCLFASTVAIAFNANFRSVPHARRVFALALLAIASTLGFGVWRLQTSHHEPAITVALVASDNPYANLPTSNDSLAVFRRYTVEVPPLAARGAKLIVTPEYIGDFSANPSKDQTPALDRLFGDVARSQNVTIEVGLGRVVDQNNQFNEARVYSPGGDVAVYDKHHLLPGYESRFTPGTTTTLIQTNHVPWGVQICKDADFPALSRQYSAENIGLLLLSANDFKADAWLHSRMAILRGVEGGFSIARCARNGS